MVVYHSMGVSLLLYNMVQPMSYHSIKEYNAKGKGRHLAMCGMIVGDRQTNKFGMIECYGCRRALRKQLEE